MYVHTKSMKRNKVPMPAVTWVVFLFVAVQLLGSQ